MNIKILRDFGWAVFRINQMKRMNEWSILNDWIDEWSGGAFGFASVNVDDRESFGVFLFPEGDNRQPKVPMSLDQMIDFLEWMED
jgi:hypothetical protein